MSQRIQQLDELTRVAVPKVFQEMLAMEVKAEEAVALPEDPDGRIISAVGFTGNASGIIYLDATMTFAREITSLLLAIPPEEMDGDEMVADAMGELTNMVVGYVKSRLCDSGLPCVLTIPSILRGQRLKVERASSITRRTIGFRNCHRHLLVQMLLKD